MFVPVYYLGPFVICSLVCALICLSIRKLRRYTLRALVLPSAFGFSSLVGFVAFYIILERILYPAASPPWVGWIVFFGVQLMLGCVGAWIALFITKRIEAILFR
jgi:hypothetical protein